MDPDNENDVLRQMHLRAEERVRTAQQFLQRHPLVGMRAEEAERLAREAGVVYRDVEVHGGVFSADLRPGRITAMVDDGVVVSAEVGN